MKTKIFILKKLNTLEDLFLADESCAFEGLLVTAR